MEVPIGHAYPQDLARLVRQRWADQGPSHGESEGALAASDAQHAIASPGVLERVLSVCYQASLLREEDRPVTFRMALAGPDAFPPSGGPPEGLHRLVLSRTRPFDAHELRGLAPAAVFQRSLIGVQLESDNELRVWGLVHSGLRWLHAVQGGRRIGQSIPLVLMVAVTGPGRVLVSKGTRTLAGLAGGTLADVATDVFATPWLVSLFHELHRALWSEHGAAFDRSRERYAPLAPEFVRKLTEHVLRRIVSTIRGARHGGTLVVLPAANAEELVAGGRYLTLKYPFRDEEPRRRVLALAVQIMSGLAHEHASSGVRVGWEEYEASTDSRLGALDEALFDVAHLVALLTHVDGAVVMTDRLELLGFGAEISGALPEVDSVDRSLDILAAQRCVEPTDRVGTRHRSAYRLCQELHEALVIVVSQDGGVRFVRWQEGRVTYFDQIATGPWEV